MTDLPARLREIAALREKATEGPWKSVATGSEGCSVLAPKGAKVRFRVARLISGPLEKCEADAAFIAAAGSLTPEDWQRLAEPPLDAAWREAESALPEGWMMVVGTGPAHRVAEAFGATAGPIEIAWPIVLVTAGADSPAAALQSLAARLRARADGAEGETA